MEVTQLTSCFCIVNAQFFSIVSQIGHYSLFKSLHSLFIVSSFDMSVSLVSLLSSYVIKGYMALKPLSIFENDSTIFKDPLCFVNHVHIVGLSPKQETHIF